MENIFSAFELENTTRFASFKKKKILRSFGKKKLGHVRHVHCVICVDYFGFSTTDCVIYVDYFGFSTMDFVIYVDYFGFSTVDCVIYKRINYFGFSTMDSYCIAIS